MVECGGLENRFGGDSSDEGSNPSPSVFEPDSPYLLDVCVSPARVWRQRSNRLGGRTGAAAGCWLPHCYPMGATLTAGRCP